MQQQAIPGEAPAPETNGQPRGGSGDAFVDAALEAFEGLGGDVANDTAAPPKRKVREQPAPEEDAQGAPEGDAEDEESPAAGLKDEEEAEAEDEGAEEEAHARGSKEEPFSVKDLPSDKYIELKIDGEKRTVSLAELATGYIGQQTINQRLNQTKAMADEAQAAIKKANDTREQVRAAMKEFLSDPDQIFAYFNETGEREEVITAVAMKLAEQVRKFRENPDARLRFQRERDEARLRWEREQWEASKRAEASAKEQQELQQRFIALVKPGWEAGLRKAGFPQPTRELYEEVMVRCRQRTESGANLTSDDVAEFTYRACKLLELKPRGAQRPRPAPPPAPKERETRRNGKDPWEGKSSVEKRKSADYFLRNLRSKDFRL